MMKKQKEKKTKEQLENEAKNEEVKKLLIRSNFLTEYTQHSNSTLQAKISEEIRVRKHNATYDMVNCFHKDFVIKEYERMQLEE